MTLRSHFRLLVAAFLLLGSALVGVRHGYADGVVPCSDNPERSCELLSVTPTATDEERVLKITVGTASLQSIVHPYEGFSGTIQVVRGDTDGDGSPEFVTTPGPGLINPKVKVWAMDGTLEAEFSVYGSTYDNGMSLALGDFDNDGMDEIAVAPMQARAANIRIFHYNTTTQAYDLRDGFFPNIGAGGADLYSGDVVSDDGDDLIVVARPWNGTVTILHASEQSHFYKSYQRMTTVRPFARSYSGAVSVVVGNVLGDDKDELIVTPQGGANPEVKVYGGYAYNGQTGTLNLQSIFRVANNDFSSSPTSGLSLAVGNVTGDEHDEIVTAPRERSGNVRVWQYWPHDTVKYSATPLFRPIAYHSLPHEMHGVTMIVRDLVPDRAGSLDFEHDEIFLAPREGSSRILGFRYNSAVVSRRLERVHRFSPFFSDYTGGMMFDQSIQ